MSNPVSTTTRFDVPTLFENKKKMTLYNHF